MASVSASITGPDQFTSAIAVNACNGFNVSVWGLDSAVATVTLQRSSDDGASWRDVMTYIASTEDSGFEFEDMLYRIGVKSGDYESGTVLVRIGA